MIGINMYARNGEKFWRAEIVIDEKYIYKDFSYDQLEEAKDFIRELNERADRH